MTRRMIPRAFSIAAAWLSLGMVLSASSCDQPDPLDAMMDKVQMQMLEHWNAERANKLALQAMTAMMQSPSHQAAMRAGEDEWLRHNGRTDCPGNTCDKKKDDISTP